MAVLKEVEHHVEEEEGELFPAVQKTLALKSSRRWANRWRRSFFFYFVFDELGKGRAREKRSPAETDAAVPSLELVRVV
jgi:hypothetical protein